MSSRACSSRSNTLLIHGAGGVVGLDAAVNAPADGYTIVMARVSVGYGAPICAGKQQMLQRLAPVGILTTAPTLIVTRPDRFPDTKALLAEARARPGTVSMRHSGNGTTSQVFILRLQLNEPVKVNIIPCRGSGPGIADLLAGNVDCFADKLTSSMPHIPSGKLRPLMNFGLEPISDLPKVPTLQEVGCMPFEGGTTAGVFVRLDTPKRWFSLCGLSARRVSNFSCGTVAKVRARCARFLSMPASARVGGAS